MSITHLDRLCKEFEANHWVIIEERSQNLTWRIARPNGDFPLTLEFTSGWKDSIGHILYKEIERAIACDVVGHPEVNYLYFGKKCNRRFLRELIEFVAAICSLERNAESSHNKANSADAKSSAAD